MLENKQTSLIHLPARRAIRLIAASLLVASAMVEGCLVQLRVRGLLKMVRQLCGAERQNVIFLKVKLTTDGVKF